uniref:Uncharacterized protein n=1 Tax=Mola mola TaxID=94237 RepID=A0A3Q3W644_MOLML
MLFFRRAICFWTTTELYQSTARAELRLYSVVSLISSLHVIIYNAECQAISFYGFCLLKIYEEDEGFGTPQVLCHQSLRMVYSTIDENYTEGTLQLLSDLLQPGYYPPRDITLHLLHGILLDPQCPYHLCVQAYNLLIRTQRYSLEHHLADKNAIPWNWELLTSVMANQVVRMLLEYVVQTLEDDFQAKRSISALHLSIAKETLSCDQRDVLKWLFSAIMKSTEHDESTEVARGRDEQIRLITKKTKLSFFLVWPFLHLFHIQLLMFTFLSPPEWCPSSRGCCPFVLLISRMLLLESLQSKRLRCKLLEHLLDYACPVKTSLSMSLSLLLHFMKNCTLAPDPTVNITLVSFLHLLGQPLLSMNIVALTYGFIH